MDENLQHIENLFRDALGSNEDNPSPKVWDSIDNRLDKEEVLSVHNKYTALKRVAVLLLLCLVGLGLYEVNMYSNNIAQENNIEASKSVAAKTNDGNALRNADSVSLHKNIDVASSEKTGIKTGIELPVVANATQNKLPLLHTQSSTAIVQQNKLPDFSYTVNSKQSFANKPSLKHVFKKSIEPYPAQKSVLIGSAKIYNPAAQKEGLNTGRINESLTDSSGINKLFKTEILNNAPSQADTKNTTASNIKTKEKAVSRFSGTAFFSPDFASYHLKNNIVSNQQNEAEQAAKNEKHEFSSSAGLWVDYKLNKHVALQSGLAFSSTTIIADPKTVYAQKDNSGTVKFRINTSSGYGYVLPSFANNPAVGDSLYAFTTTHTLQYISIPLSLKYSISSGQCTFSSLVGISANLLMKGRIETSLENNVSTDNAVINKLTGLKKLYVSGITGLGINYKVTKAASLSFQPVYRFALNSMNKNTDVSSYPNSFGLQFGVSFGF